jgi:hypothetical protein
MSEPLPVPLLFFTSRTARDSYFFCPRFRYLGNHWGPSGYGIQPAKQSIPLATGARVHDVLYPVLQYCVEHDAVPPPSLVGAAAQAALDQYREDVRAHGLSYWGDDAAFARMVSEQEHLIVGLPMLWAIHELPRLLQEWRIILAEPRDVSVYRCTCGLGDGIPPWEAHVARECQGIGLQTGPDYVAQHRVALATHRYGEFKTRNAPLTDAWAESYETRVQVQLGTLGVEQRYGIQIEQVVLHGLCKGQTRSNKELGEYQDSRLCWAWFKPGSPPASADEWAYEYEWWDAVENRMRRLGKGWERRWVGEFSGPHGPGLPGWIQELPEWTVAKMLRTVGPLQRNPMVKDAALRQWVYLEAEIQQKLQELYPTLQANGFDWTAPNVQDQLDLFFPQSWDCQRFGARYPCAMKKICHHEPGWQDPFSIGYVNRRPHHPAEMAQAVARGLMPADEVWEGDEA